MISFSCFRRCRHNHQIPFQTPFAFDLILLLFSEDERNGTMGLINNPTTRRKLVSFISRFNSPLCLLCYVGGFVWFLALAYPPHIAKTYFSENALLPGLVSSKLYLHNAPAKYLSELKDVYEQLKAKDSDRETFSNQMPTHWFEAAFRVLGLETHVQNFSFVYPDGLVKDQHFPGQNVFGILRAPRAASTEALVMTAPYRPLDASDKTAGGIALMLALAKAFRSQSLIILYESPLFCDLCRTHVLGQGHHLSRHRV
jgi:glycosylphosphatidylinositol transamidase